MRIAKCKTGGPHHALEVFPGDSQRIEDFDFTIPYRTVCGILIRVGHMDFGEPDCPKCLERGRPVREMKCVLSGGPNGYVYCVLTDQSLESGFHSELLAYKSICKGIYPADSCIVVIKEPDCPVVA